MYKHPGNISKIFKKNISSRTNDINSLVHCQHIDAHTWTKVNIDGGHERFSWSRILKKKAKLYKVKTMHICFSSIKNLSHELTHFQFEVHWFLKFSEYFFCFVLGRTIHFSIKGCGAGMVEPEFRHFCWSGSQSGIFIIGSVSKPSTSILWSCL